MAGTAARRPQQPRRSDARWPGRRGAAPRGARAGSGRHSDLARLCRALDRHAPAPGRAAPAPALAPSAARPRSPRPQLDADARRRRAAGPGWRSAWSTARTSRRGNRWSSTSTRAAPGWPWAARAAAAPPCSGPSWARRSTGSGPRSCTCTSSSRGGGSLAADAAALPHAGTAVAGRGRVPHRAARRPAGAGGGRPPRRGDRRAAPVDPAARRRHRGAQRPSSTTPIPARGSAGAAPAAPGRGRGRADLRAHRGPRRARRPPGRGRATSGSSCRCPTGRTTPSPGIPPRAVPELAAARAGAGRRGRAGVPAAPSPATWRPAAPAGQPFPPPIRDRGAAGRPGAAPAAAGADERRGRQRRPAAARSARAATRASRWSSTCCARAGCCRRAARQRPVDGPGRLRRSTCAPPGPRCCASASDRRTPSARRRRAAPGWTRRDEAGARRWVAALDGRRASSSRTTSARPRSGPALAALPAARRRAAASRSWRPSEPRAALPGTTRDRSPPCAGPGPGCCSARVRATPICSGVRLPRLPLPAAARAAAGWSTGTAWTACRSPAGPRGRPAPSADRSEQLERRPDLLRRVPGQLVTLGLVDDELGVLAAEVGLEDDVDRRADVVLGVGAVDVRAGDVPRGGCRPRPGPRPGRCRGRRSGSPRHRARRRRRRPGGAPRAGRRRSAAGWPGPRRAGPRTRAPRCRRRRR